LIFTGERTNEKGAIQQRLSNGRKNSATQLLPFKSFCPFASCKWV